MLQPAFDLYLKSAIAGYAEDNIASGRWPKEDAVAWSRAAFEKSLPQGLETPNNYIFEIHNDAKEFIVGVIWLAVVEKNGINSAFVYDVEIKPEFRRQGYARDAFKALEPIVRSLGLTEIGLHVFGHNPGAEALYCSLGYKVTGVNMLKKLGPVGT